MTKRLILSFLMIGITIAGVTSATVAYFNDAAIKTGNTFATGTVAVDEAWTSGLPFSFLNLTPGAVSDSGIIGVGYGGSILADLYFGVRDNGNQNNTNLIPILDYYIEEVDSGGVHQRDVTSWNSVNDAFANWNKIADSVNNGDWKYYRIHIRVHDDAGNIYQEKTAGNDVIIYAVQHGFPTPTQHPWEFTTL